MAEPINPFEPDAVHKMNAVLRSCEQTDALCQAYRAAGLDPSKAEQENAEHRKLVSGLKRAFFPNEL